MYRPEGGASSLTVSLISASEFFLFDLAAGTLEALWHLSMSDVRMERTSRRISGSSIRVKDSRGSRKDEGKAVNRLLLS